MLSKQTARLFVAALLLVGGSGAFGKEIPRVYTYQPRDISPIIGAEVGGQPVQIDEGSNWQWKMDAGRLRSQSESDIVLDDMAGTRKFLTQCTSTPEICAGQSSTVSHDAEWIVYQKSIGSQFFEVWATYTHSPINDHPFNATSNELWAYNIEADKHYNLTSGHHDVTPKFCGNKLLFASDREAMYPPYQTSNPYKEKGLQIWSAVFDEGKLSDLKNLTPHEAIAMSPDCLQDGSIIYSSYQGYSKRGEYQFTSTPQNIWWVNIIDGNGANALTTVSLGAHNSPYIPTAELISDELSDWGGAKVSTMLILRPARMVAIIDGFAFICVGNYYRTNHVGGGGELLCYVQTAYEGVSKLDNWDYRQAGATSKEEGSAAFVPRTLRSFTPWGHGFDNPQRFDKESRIMGKANYASPYPGGKLMMTWFDGACYEPVFSQGLDWATRAKMGGGPTCQLKICLTDLEPTSNPHKQCEVLVGNWDENVWDAHPVVPYKRLFGQDLPESTPELVVGEQTQLRVVDFGEMELTGRPSGDQNQALKNRYKNQGHATPDVETGRMDRFCVDIIEPWMEEPPRPGYKSRTLHQCVAPKEDGSLVMDVPPDKLIVMYGIDSKFVFPKGRDPHWYECINVEHGLCIVAEDQMFHSLRKGEKRTCHGCHDAHGEERWIEVGGVPAEVRFKKTQAYAPGC